MFQSRTAIGRPVVKVDAVVTENWVASDEAVAAAAAEQAMALARAAVKAARDVEALTSSLALDYLPDTSEGEGDASADSFYNAKDILRLRLERARLSEMEKTGAVQSSEELPPSSADEAHLNGDWTESDLMTLSKMSRLFEKESCNSEQGASSWEQVEADFHSGDEKEEDGESNPLSATEEQVLPEIAVRNRENVAVKSKRRKERLLKRERAIAKAEKAAEATASAASSRLKRSSITTDSANDPVRTYLREIGRSRLLNSAEEIELSQGIQVGCLSLR